MMAQEGNLIVICMMTLSILVLISSTANKLATVRLRFQFSFWEKFSSNENSDYKDSDRARGEIQPGWNLRHVIASFNSRVFLSEPRMNLKIANRPEIRHVITHLVDYVLGH